MARRSRTMVLALLMLAVPLGAPQKCVPAPAAPIVAPAVYPQEGQVFQRDATGFADIPIVHPPVADGSASVRYDQQPWRMLDTWAGNGITGTLADVPVGWHTVQVKTRRNPDVLFTVSIGVGDVFVLDGQSNMIMEGETRRVSLFGATVLPVRLAQAATSLFKPAHDSLWTPNQQRGSAWPLVADRITAGTGVPVGFVAAAEGATGLVDPPHWAVGGFFWNRMITNTLVASAGTGRVAAVLKDQGETDANFGVASGAFKAALCGYPADLEAALGVPTPLVVSQTGTFPLVSEDRLEPIRVAQREAVRDCPHVFGGFETRDLAKNVTGHYADAAIPELARRWCQAIAALPLYASGPAPACD